MQKLIKLIATFFYIGYLPLMPGTFASAGSILGYLFVKNNFFIYLSLAVLVTILGFFTAGKAEKIFGGKDPRKVVIDEVCGMWWSYFLIPFNFRNVIAGFFLFRLFDIIKPFPAKKAENLKGSAGIMLDDIIAALYTNIILQVINVVK